MVVASGSGSWLDYVEFDGKLYWTIDEERQKWLAANDEALSAAHREMLLPSDSS